jgi:Fe-S cluster biogenesis protein NfuA
MPAADGAILFALSFPTATSASAALRGRIEAELDLVRPWIRDDGGDVELIDIEAGTVRIRFRGACIRCPSSDMTLRHGIERHLMSRVPGVRRVIAVED